MPTVVFPGGGGSGGAGTPGRGIAGVSANGTTATVTYSDASTPSNFTLPTINPLVVTGLTGGSAGCLTYLKSPGVVADLDSSMRTKLRDNVPLYFKHPTNGNYYLIQVGQVTGLTGLTGTYVVALSQKTSNAGTNVTWYAPTDTAAYNLLAPSTWLSYLEPGRAINATDVVFNLGLGSIRFADISGTTVNTVQDKVILTGTYAYANGAAFPGGIWTYPWGTFGSTFRFGSADTSLAPAGGIAEFNDSGNVLLAAAHVGITDFINGGSQVVLSKGDGAVQPFWLLNRISGTGSAPVAVGVRANMNGTVGSRTFTVGYFNGSTTWVDCTEATSGPQLAPTLSGSVGFRMVLDTIGTFVGAKIWPTLSAEPADYTVWGWQSAVAAAGGTGVATAFGRIWVGDFGAYSGAPSSAPRGP